MTDLADITQFLDQQNPPDLAEDWDNVGLLLGDPQSKTIRVLTCLTLTPDVAAEAVNKNVNLIVSHHPILFRPIQKIASTTSEGAMLLKLIQHGIAVYSPHTAFDSAAEGINQQIAMRFGLTEIQPLRPTDENESIGTGRFGELPERMSLKELAARIRDEFRLPAVQFAGDPDMSVQRLGIACGSAAEFLTDARKAGCQAFLTGEARFHSALEARTEGIGLILIGHYASERPAVEQLATVIADQFPQLDVWASDVETDPLQWSIT
ncbi:Nif3-like dinuclear metal center hexameric protein [Thalassoroseus pseudoceratinae]|uniref:Nif3-like dinuclear metal center hexameric protein n=1 Tax=Thalassoroseus pseudoceratinae TaxID=2713176 RepID=UPI0014224DD0|nr:Nif3-like dinuclear metal center hexameric protein [Thalassoroseus pseudoceratinae]